MILIHIRGRLTPPVAGDNARADATAIEGCETRPRVTSTIGSNEMDLMNSLKKKEAKDDDWKIPTYLYKQYKMNWKGTKYLIDRVWFKKDFKDCR